jgi:hypothetical protein
MFRFTIRDVLWLTALMAMGISWWADIRRRDSVIKSAELKVEESEFRLDRARADTNTVREQAAKRERLLSMQYLLERAKTDSVLKAQLEDPALRAQWAKLYPEMRGMPVASDEP